MTFPVTFQFVVNIHDGTFHLFERDAELPVPPCPNMLLSGFGLLNTAGPVAGFDNVVRRVVVDGNTNRAKLLLFGTREATRDLDEVRSLLPQGWRYMGPVNAADEGTKSVFEG